MHMSRSHVVARASNVAIIPNANWIANGVTLNKVKSTFVGVMICNRGYMYVSRWSSLYFYSL